MRKIYSFLTNIFERSVFFIIGFHLILSLISYWLIILCQDIIIFNVNLSVIIGLLIFLSYGFFMFILPHLIKYND